MAKDDLFPLNYEDWKHCITVKCGIPLTKKYIEERIVTLNNVKSEETKKFVKLYGEDYTRQVISWFVLAKDEFANR